MVDFYGQEDNPGSKWAVPLIFAAISIPFLLSSCEDNTRDCYRSKSDCTKDWSDTSCTTGPDTNSCPYVGRSYHGGFYGIGGRARSENAIGVTRGGFGGTGKSFFRGG